MHKSARGFTLIELVVVIAILGILAAVALPRFVNITGQAQQAAFDGVVGGFRSAVQLAHAQWLADGADATVSTVNIEGGMVAVTAAGWPDENAYTPVNLYAALMNGRLNTGQGGWMTADVGTAHTFTFANGSSFTYNANGTITVP